MDDVKKLEEAKRLYKDANADQRYVLERLFPELRKSEDEKMLRVIREGFNILDKDDEWYGGITNGQILAWLLEKQGEKPNNVYDKELSEILGCVIRRYINDPNISYTEREKVSREIVPYVERLEKQGEQKSIWSEEDENRFSNLIYLVEHSDEGKGTKEGFVKFINRLKSLKEIYTWKPSEEQMEGLASIVDGLANICGEDCAYDLRTLQGDLKKLKEE